MKYQLQTEEQDQEEQLNQKSLSKKSSHKKFFAGQLASREIQEYDKYQYPANLKIAQEHALATRIGQDMSFKDLQNLENGYKEVEKYCQCCGYQVQKKLFDMSVETEELGFLGSGYPLFFDFMKFSFAIIFLIFVTSGLYNMSSNLLGDNCKVINQLNQKFNQDIDKKNQCVSSWIMNISFANKINNSKFVQLQSIVNFSTILIIIIALQYFRKSQREINVICDEKNVTASDYALCIKFIPTGLNDVDYLAEIRNLMFDLGYNIIKFNLAYDLKELEKIQNELNNLMIKKIKCNQEIKQQRKNKQQQKDQQKDNKDNLLSNIAIGFKEQTELTALSLKIEEEFQQKNKQLKELLNELDSGKSDKFIGIAFISFETEDQRDDCYEKHKLLNTRQKLKRFMGRDQENQLEILGKKVVVELAAEPNDINWQALNCSTIRKQIMRMISLIIDLVVMLGLFTLTVYIIKKQNDVKNTIEGKSEEEQKRIRDSVTYIGYGISLFTSISNYVLAQTMYYTTNIEQWSTKTRLNVKLSTKLALAQFMNTALLQFIISYLVTNNYYGVGGLIYNQTQVFITDFIISISVGLINPAFIMQNLFKYIYNRYDYPQLYQAQIQLLYENPEFKLSYLYAQLIKTCFFCAFYSPVIPIGTLFSMLSILCLYWLHKYNLLRRSVVKEQQSAELSQELTELIEYVIVIYSFTNFIFEYFIMKSVQSTSIVGLVIGLLNAFLPMDRINLKLFPPRPDQNEILTYGEAEKHLEIDYGRSNPATKQFELGRFQQKFSCVLETNEQSYEQQQQ